MKVLIVEDETIACEYLRKLLESTNEGLEICGVSESISQTVNWLKNNPTPDLIFMDIHLSDGSAFSIFDIIPVETPIIFTTAYDEYAINAFRVNSVDYLLKPVQEDELKRAIEKFKKLSSVERKNYIQQQSTSISNGKFYKKILIPHKDSLVPVSVDEIIYMYTSEHQTFLCTVGDKKYAYNKTLDSIMHNLDRAMFFRANKQFIISKEHIKNITVWFDRRLLLTLDVETPERIYISKNKSSEFKEWITGNAP